MTAAGRMRSLHVEMSAADCGYCCAVSNGIGSESKSLFWQGVRHTLIKLSGSNFPFIAHKQKEACNAFFRQIMQHLSI